MKAIIRSIRLCSNARQFTSSTESASQFQRMILTGVGQDRTGLVKDITDVILENGGNVVDSRMQQMAGDFTMMILLDIPTVKVDHFQTELKSDPRLEGQDLQIKQSSKATHTHETYTAYHITVAGADRPGIVYDIASLLSSCGADIDRMKTHRREKTDGKPAEFALDGRIFISKLVSLDSLRKALAEVEKKDSLVINITEDLHPHND